MNEDKCPSPRRLPDPRLCRTRPLLAVCQFSICQVEAPLECPQALSFGGAFLCRSKKVSGKDAAERARVEGSVVRGQGPEGLIPKPPKVAARILVVDDEPMMCECLLGMLALDAYEVATASCAHDALVLFTRQKFDLVLTDYNLPGMKGDELAAAIKALVPDQPVAFITGDGEFLASNAARPSGVDAVLAKPFDLEELRGSVSQLLRRMAKGSD